MVPHKFTHGCSIYLFLTLGDVDQIILTSLVIFLILYWYCNITFLTGLSGVDLFMADLKALETYASYFYHLSKLWSRPLPEVYDPQEVADYFNRRPHIVALRLLEVVKFIVTSEFQTFNLISPLLSEDLFSVKYTIPYFRL